MVSLLEFIFENVSLLVHNRDRMADYSAYPLADPDVQFSRIRLLKVNDSLSAAKTNLHIFMDNSRIWKWKHL